MKNWAETLALETLANFEVVPVDRSRNLASRCGKTSCRVGWSRELPCWDPLPRAQQLFVLRPVPRSLPVLCCSHAVSGPCLAHPSPGVAPDIGLTLPAWLGHHEAEPLLGRTLPLPAVPAPLPLCRWPGCSMRSQLELIQQRDLLVSYLCCGG